MKINILQNFQGFTLLFEFTKFSEIQALVCLSIFMFKHFQLILEHSTDNNFASS